MGPYLPKPVTTQKSSSGIYTLSKKNKKLYWGTCEMQGWRQAMEDRIIVEEHDNVKIFAILDGHGGFEVAEFARQYFTKELLAHPKFKQNTYKDAIKETFFQMDKLLVGEEGKQKIIKIKEAEAERLAIEKAKQEEEKKKKQEEDGDRTPREDDEDGNKTPPVNDEDGDKTPPANDEKNQIQVEEQKNQDQVDNEMNVDQNKAGCTATVIIIVDDIIYYANAGDSRTILCRKNAIHQFNQDHKPDQENELARIQNAGGFVSEGRINGGINLSRAIGDLEYKNNPNLPQEKQLITALPDIQQQQIQDDDRWILLGCDGVYDSKSNEELKAIIDSKLAREEKNQNKPLQEKSAQVIKEVILENLAPNIGNKGCDNMSGILIQFK